VVHARTLPAIKGTPNQEKTASG